MHGRTRNAVRQIGNRGWQSGVIGYYKYEAGEGEEKIDLKHLIKVANLMSNAGEIAWSDDRPPDRKAAMEAFQELSRSGVLHKALQAMLNLAHGDEPNAAIADIENLGGAGRPTGTTHDFAEQKLAGSAYLPAVKRFRELEGDQTRPGRAVVNFVADLEARNARDEPTTLELLAEMGNEERSSKIADLNDNGLKNPNVVKAMATFFDHVDTGRVRLPVPGTASAANPPRRLSFGQPPTGPIASAKRPNPQALQAQAASSPPPDPELPDDMLADAAKVGVQKMKKQGDVETKNPVWERFMEPFDAQSAEHGLAWKDLKKLQQDTRDQLVDAIIGKGSDDATMALREDVHDFLDTVCPFMTTTTIDPGSVTGQWLASKT